MAALGVGIAAGEFGSNIIHARELRCIRVRMPLAGDVDRAIKTQEEHRQDDCDTDVKAHGGV